MEARSKESAVPAQEDAGGSAGTAGEHPARAAVLASGGSYFDEGSGDRPVTASYCDPVDLVWIEAARRLGVRVRRSDAVFASWDGAGTLTLSTSAGFDPDDCVAQLVLHELCHALVEGAEAWGRPDWGLDNVDERDLSREHAAQRLQGRLAAPYGLRQLLAPTTKWRAYYDALPDDPLDGPEEDPAVALARGGWERAQAEAWMGPLRQALEATATIARAVGSIAPAGSLWRHADR